MNINGGFENNGRGWSGQGEWEVTSEDSRSGTYSVVRRGVALPVSAFTTQLIACVPGQHLKLTGYVKRVGASGSGRVRVSFWRGCPGCAEVASVAGDLITYADWRPSSLVTVVPPQASLYRIEVAADNQPGTDIYFDDLALSIAELELPALVDMSTPTLIDPRILGRSRVATQYTASLKFLAYLQALLAPLNNIQETMILNLLQTDIDLAHGVNLDVLGEIVGIGRVVPSAIPVVFFGFSDQVSAGNFGEARFREEDESMFAATNLQDPEYRLLIKAKILRNHSRGTNEDIIRAISFLFGIDVILITDIGSMEISITLGRALTPTEISMLNDLDILPRPAGVKINRINRSLPGAYFGFDGQLNALNFGEENDPSIGGNFREEF